MADKSVPEVEPLDDMTFMAQARSILSRLTPMQRGLALWFLTTDENPEALGEVLDASFELVSLAGALKNAEDLTPSVRWLRSQFDVARINVTDRDGKTSRRSRSRG